MLDKNGKESIEKTEQDTGLIPFKRGTLTVFRPANQASELAKEGWVKA
jgi:hypothetical protein